MLFPRKRPEELEFKEVLYTKQDWVATITINRPFNYNAYSTPSGRVVPEFAMKDLREIIHPPFRIVYRREKRKILIVRIWRSERLLKLP